MSAQREPRWRAGQMLRTWYGGAGTAGWQKQVTGNTDVLTTKQNGGASETLPPLIPAVKPPPQ